MSIDSSFDELPPQTRELPIRRKEFYIFGQGILFAMSSTIHRAGFRSYSLPHTFTVFQSTTVNELDPIISSESFGGCSVTAPHTTSIGKYCHSVSEDAQLIGEINTLIPECDGMRGENTNWIGFEAVMRNSSLRSKIPLDTGLVLGTGRLARAALYALYKSGFKTIYLFSRIETVAAPITKAFAPIFDITVLTSLSDFKKDTSLPRPDVIIGTIPANETTQDLFPDILWEKPQGICIDTSYKPRETPLLMKTKEKKGWAVVNAAEVLLEQGSAQFELWTRKPAPKEIMRQALRDRDSKLSCGK